MKLGNEGEMLARGLVDKVQLAAFFHEIEPKLARYPAVDPPAFRRRLLEVCKR